MSLQSDSGFSGCTSAAGREAAATAAGLAGTAEATEAAASTLTVAAAICACIAAVASRSVNSGKSVGFRGVSSTPFDSRGGLELGIGGRCARSMRPRLVALTVTACGSGDTGGEDEAAMGDGECSGGGILICVHCMREGRVAW